MSSVLTYMSTGKSISIVIRCHSPYNKLQIMADVRARQPNFSAADEVLLLGEVQRRESRLFSAFSGPGLSKKRKDQAWDEVVEAFNSQSSSGYKRTVPQLKKKYNNIKSEAKTKLSKRKHPPTGGGPPDAEMSIAQQMFLDMAGDAPNIQGVSGGMESVSHGEVESLILVAEALSSPFCEPANTPQPSTSAIYPPVLFDDPEPSSNQPEVFPLPGAQKTRNPRSDKVESDLRIEVLRLEKERLQAALELVKLKQRQAVEKHEAKMAILNTKKANLGL